MEFFKAIEARHSYRGPFTEAAVPEEDIIKILDAGLRAPSGCNAQTTRFIVVTNAKTRAEIAALMPGDAVNTAPVLLVAVTKKHTFDFGLDFELEDYAAAVENILLAVTALGYASCWFDGETRLNGVCQALKKMLDVPHGEQVRTVLPIGIPVHTGKQAPRKDFSERVLWRR